MKLIYAAEAIDDLSRLRTFIAKHNPEAAQRIAQALLASIEQLKNFPTMGKPVKLSPNPVAFRDLITRFYTVRYVQSSDHIVVLRVWHHREDH